MNEHLDDESAPWYGRAFLYELAHVVFSGEPDEELFSALSSDECTGTLEAIGATCPKIGALANRLGGLSLKDLPQAKSAYSRVMLGLGKRASHPWESAYRSPRRLLIQVETLEVRNAYRAFGYLPKMYPHVADDHISLECAFMAALAKRSIDEAEGGDQAGLRELARGQAAFLDEHFLKWLPSYSADLRKDAPGTLYDLTASALSTFAGQDAVFLSDFIGR